MSDDDISRKDITLKELDHIQAIFGRFDALFFLMKQVCLAAITAVFVAPESRKLYFILHHAWIIPILFFIFDSGFRFFYWTRYVIRKEEITKYVNEGNLIELPLLYQITAPPHSLLSSKKIWRRSIKLYDVAFYAVLFLIVIAVAERF